MFLQISVFREILKCPLLTAFKFNVELHSIYRVYILIVIKWEVLYNFHLIVIFLGEIIMIGVSMN